MERRRNITHGDGSSRATRALLVLIALLFGVTIAEAAGILTVIGGATMASAVVAGGVAFGATVTLVLLIESALGLL